MTSIKPYRIPAKYLTKDSIPSGYTLEYAVGKALRIQSYDPAYIEHIKEDLNDAESDIECVKGLENPRNPDSRTAYSEEIDDFEQYRSLVSDELKEVENDIECSEIHDVIEQQRSKLLEELEQNKSELLKKLEEYKKDLINALKQHRLAQFFLRKMKNEVSDNLSQGKKTLLSIDKSIHLSQSELGPKFPDLDLNATTFTVTSLYEWFAQHGYLVDEWSVEYANKILQKDSVRAPDTTIATDDELKAPHQQPEKGCKEECNLSVEGNYTNKRKTQSNIILSYSMLIASLVKLLYELSQEDKKRNDWKLSEKNNKSKIIDRLAETKAPGLSKSSIDRHIRNSMNINKEKKVQREIEKTPYLTLIKLLTEQCFKVSQETKIREEWKKNNEQDLDKIFAFLENENLTDISADEIKRIFNKGQDEITQNQKMKT